MHHLAKISAPSHSNIVARERLFKLLDDAHDRATVWISSPGGSGKTSLVASYLNERKISHIWYRIDAGDDDIATFFYYMGLATKKAAPRFKNPMPLLTSEYLEGIPVFALRYFEEMARRLKAPFVIVLDNYQDVPEASGFHEILHIGMKSLPQGIGMMVISRNHPTSHYSRLLFSDRMAQIGWGDIRLDQEETNAIVQSKTGTVLSAETVSLFRQQTGGWVAGLVLLLENARRRGSESLMSGKRPMEEFFPYFASEIFEKTDPDTRDFLLKTAFLPVMNAEMAESLTSCRRAEDILKKLHEHNFFIEYRFEKTSVYLYHHLFRDFLLDRAMASYPETMITEIRQKAANVLMINGQTEDAVRLLIDSEDFGTMIPLVLEHAGNLVAQGRSVVLAAWIDAIPSHLVSSHPWLLYWKGVSLFSCDIMESRACYEQAFHAFNRNEDENGVLLSWSGVVDTYLFESNDYKPLDFWIRWFDERMERNPFFPSIDIETAVLSSMVGAGLWSRLDHPALKPHVQRLTSIYLSGMDESICSRTLFFTVMFYSWMGHYQEAGVILAQAKKRSEFQSLSPLVQITLKMIEAHYAVVIGEPLDMVQKLVSEGRSLADDSGVHLMDYMLIGQEGYGILASGAHGLSDPYLKQLESAVTSERKLTRCLYVDMLSLHYLHKGNPHQVIASAEESEKLSREFGMIFVQGSSRLLKAQAYHELGDCARALENVMHAENIFTRMGSRFFLYSCGMVKACIHLDHGYDRFGLPILRKALAIGRADGYASAPYLWRKSVICRLCVKALEAGIETEFVQNLIRKQNLRPALSPVGIETWPWPVRIYTMGRFSLMVHDEPVNVSGKTQKKPFLLLKALIAFGGRDIKEETLADLLWPDAEGDAGHNAFTTTLARLRKLIGYDSAIQLSGGRVFLDNRCCWVDRWAFERLCTRTETVLGQIQDGLTDLESLKKVAAKAAGLYQGTFLASDDDQPWAVPPRERIRSRYLHLVGQTGTFLSQEGDDETAIRYYQMGLEAEPLAEYLHQSLISAYLRLDRLAEALAAFKQCRKILDSHSVPLSHKTEELRRQIHKN